jgi:mRNA-degrading endonuclease RelE of RelBE toxin-antitoxin system
MNIKAYESFRKSFQNLPTSIRKKTEKQIHLLLKDFNHPSLHTKKIKGKSEIWEARVDLHYRMTFEVVEDTIFLRVVGNHDDVLKNP